MDKKKFFLITVSLLLFGFTTTPPNHKKIAKTIVSFVRYIEWPLSMKSGNFKIGVIGSFDLYKAVINETMEKGLQNRNTDVLNISNIEQLSLTPLHIIIVDNQICTADKLQRIQQITKKSPTLIITNKEGALYCGAGINFIEQNGRLNFEINKKNILNSGILISSQLETFASRVIAN
ncbi:MAG: YfiR family protein [Bacteroidales bacterium]|nr:YfiR family protein [Bacteroidales bacterium]